MRNWKTNKTSLIASNLNQDINSKSSDGSSGSAIAGIVIGSISLFILGLVVALFNIKPLDTFDYSKSI